MKQSRPISQSTSRKALGEETSVRQPRAVRVSGRKKPAFPTASISIENIQYVLPLGNGWVVKASKSSKFTAITDNKSEAITIARTIAQTKRMEMIVHGRNGTIEIRENYMV